MYNKMDDKSINSKKEVGDWKTVAQMLGKSTEACRQAWSRKEGKPYHIVKEALIKVIENRENLISSN
jgi:hypothetical protein